ncbi:acyl-CoA dehydrogenase family protein [Pseudonocardia halophobica]|uniref:Acyl-CoA dehydrogenase n=1 Tax=Pseudonocardia halophobica TaxID=29401 RepID=A0A9W6KYR8_9PSEU|nr:acyl-CoA dehydrogenase family protein [Pseudonocardia halophobica]GLL09742.1 acyl-CoA dehydrogenase [Pseudonocardia halophobica]
MTQTLERPGNAETGPDVDYVALARSIKPVIDAEADTMEAGATITKPVVDAIAENGLFWLLVPREYGGAGQDIVTSLKVVEELSRADGSVGWAFMANAFSTGVAVGFFSPEGAEEMYAGADKAITAGMILPTGTGVRVDGGYEVTGTYGFGSGSHHASWIGAGFVVLGEDGNPEMNGPEDNPVPVCRIAFVPREKVEFLGGWNVMGMAATGSDNYKVEKLFVPEAHTMDTFSTEPVRPEAVYKLGMLGIGVGGHAPVALGIAQRALEEIAQITADKKRPGYPTVVGDSEMFRRGFVEHEALLQAARLYVYQAHADAEAAAAAGTITDEHRARLRQAATWVQKVAQDVVTWAYNWGGSASIRNPSVLGRCLRDISVGAQHMLVEPMTLVEASAPIIAGYLKKENA